MKLPNGLELTFGEIVALAGDFYGVPDKPIIATTGGETAEQRFLAAFGTLATVPREKIEKELGTLTKYLDQDRVVRETGQGSFHTDAEYTKVTNGRLLTLAGRNFDHFQPHAKLAYIAGHHLAVEKAIEAARQTNPEDKKKLLMEAYAMDAFACHFLTDCFSSGHIRFER